MTSIFIRLWNVLTRPHGRSDRGATAVEYGLLVALIAAVIIAAVTALGTQLQGMFDNITNSL